MRRSSLFLLVAAWLAAAPARAIPAFARRYQTACTACHVQPPRLNSFGLAFRANGYRIPSGERSRQDKDVQLGAPEWEGPASRGRMARSGRRASSGRGPPSPSSCRSLPPEAGFVHFLRRCARCGGFCV